MQQNQQTMIVLGLAAGALVLAALITIRMNQSMKRSEQILKSVERSLVRDARAISATAAAEQPKKRAIKDEAEDEEDDLDDPDDDDDSASQVSFLEPSDLISRRKKRAKNT